MDQLWFPFNGAAESNIWLKIHPFYYQRDSNMNDIDLIDWICGSGLLMLIIMLHIDLHVLVTTNLRKLGLEFGITWYVELKLHYMLLQLYSLEVIVKILRNDRSSIRILSVSTKRAELVFVH